MSFFRTNENRFYHQMFGWEWWVSTFITKLITSLPVNQYRDSGRRYKMIYINFATGFKRVLGAPGFCPSTTHTLDGCRVYNSL